MNKGRVWFTLFITSVATIASSVSCASSSGMKEGAAGDSANGVGSGGASGSHVAGSAGVANASAGTNAAPTGGARGIGVPGGIGRAGGTGSGGAASAGPNSLGGTCVSDADCSPGLICLTPDSDALVNGGPSLGLCTRACSSDTECGAVQVGAGCVDFSTTGQSVTYCMQGCTQGGDATSFDTKCSGRPDFACTDLAAGLTPDPFCIPHCRADIECGPLRFCDRASGLCAATRGAGDPVGTVCDPASTTRTCQGICVGFGVGQGRCAELCSGFLPCMFGGPTGDVPLGLCTGAFTGTFGPLDEGFCEPSCKCTSDCDFPGHVCRAWSAAEAPLKQSLAADGMCYPVLLDSVETVCAG